MNVKYIKDKKNNISNFFPLLLQPHCRARGLVCGHDGETYESECAAWAERVSVDYKGSCAAVGINCES